MLRFENKFFVEFNSVRVLKPLYSLLVRPLLLCASSMWTPFSDVHIKSLETLQLSLENSFPTVKVYLINLFTAIMNLYQP